MTKTWQLRAVKPNFQWKKSLRNAHYFSRNISQACAVKISPVRREIFLREEKLNWVQLFAKFACEMIILTNQNASNDSRGKGSTHVCLLGIPPLCFDSEVGAKTHEEWDFAGIFRKGWKSKFLEKLCAFRKDFSHWKLGLKDHNRSHVM